MNIIIILLGLVLTVTAELSIVINYHEEIGIPEAARIKRAEESQDFDGSRILGGQISTLGAHPYLGGVLISLVDGRTSLCGSSLLSNTKMVTAAHCWTTVGAQASYFTIVFASTNLYTGGVRIVTNNVELHANYHMQNLHNDIAIITIPYVSYTDNIQPIAIATGNDAYAGSWAVAAGFGRISNSLADYNEVLRQADLQVITNAACSSVYRPGVVISSTLCTSSTNGQSICSGDSGGSLAIGSGNNRVLIGVTSFTSTRLCAPGDPAGFARVTSFASWMNARL